MKQIPNNLRKELEKIEREVGMVPHVALNAAIVHLFSTHTEEIIGEIERTNFRGVETGTGGFNNNADIRNNLRKEQLSRLSLLIKGGK